MKIKAIVLLLLNFQAQINAQISVKVTYERTYIRNYWDKFPDRLREKPNYDYTNNFALDQQR
jgi:hypothetical protein